MSLSIESLEFLKLLNEKKDLNLIEMIGDNYAILEYLIDHDYVQCHGLSLNENGTNIRITAKGKAELEFMTPLYSASAFHWVEEKIAAAESHLLELRKQQLAMIEANLKTPNGIKELQDHVNSKASNN